MLNLLFISDSAKAEYIKNVLQPVLKVIIDVVNDFDHGLKDVFEKRPSTVCIQDQIGGVTGESVARHIQMLLGKSAPTFILLHTGNGKARVIKGLYEHIVDLSQPDDVLAENIKNTLKSLLGDLWEKIYIPPKLSPAAFISSVAVPEESREDADKLVDDFLSDLEMSGFTAVDDTPSLSSAVSAPPPDSHSSSVTPAPAEHVADFPELSPHIQSQATSDEMAELLLAEVEKSILNEVPVAELSAASKESDVVFIVAPKPVPAAVKPSTVPLEIPATPQTPTAAEFRINQNPTPAEELIPEDLLLAFEENYRSESRFLRRGVYVSLFCVVCVAAGWFVIRQKPQLISSLKQRFMSLSVGTVTPATVPVAAPVQKTAPFPAPPPLITSSLPSFVPVNGYDASYSVKNPGWARYVGKNAEFRLCTVSGRLQAVQILAGKHAPISKALIKSVLQEFVGSNEYKIISKSTKAGLIVEIGSINNKGDIMIYSKNGAVKALVVSVN